MKPGDTVQLNSGGPVMTVKDVSGAQITCVYFLTAEEEQRQATFPVVCLKEADLPNLWKKKKTA